MYDNESDAEWRQKRFVRNVANGGSWSLPTSVRDRHDGMYICGLALIRGFRSKTKPTLKT